VVNFGPVTPEFNIAKNVLPVAFFFKINFSDKLFRDPPDLFSPYFHYVIDDI